MRKPVYASIQAVVEEFEPWTYTACELYEFFDRSNTDDYDIQLFGSGDFVRDFADAAATAEAVVNRFQVGSSVLDHMIADGIDYVWNAGTRRVRCASDQERDSNIASMREYIWELRAEGDYDLADMIETRLERMMTMPYAVGASRKTSMAQEVVTEDRSG